MKKGWTLYFSLLMAFLLVRCVEPYNPPELENTDLDILVVDGFVNGTDGTATVSLTKALPLNSEVRRVGLSGVTVKVISEDGAEFLLQEQFSGDPESAGVYIGTGLAVDLAKKYKLRIERDISRIYESDLVPILESAEIDEVYYQAEDDALEIYVDSKESPGKSPYYRWKYQEVWEYRSPYTSSYIYDNGEVTFRPNEEINSLYTCYQYDYTSQILLGTTTNLSRNVVTQQLVNSVARNSIKLSFIYSINVQQFALTEEEYTYWYNVDQMTESMGGLFDPMPGQVIGNIRNINDLSETVIGYFSGSTMQEKRIFVKRWELPNRFVTYNYNLCEVDTVLIEDLGSIPFQNMLIGAVTFPPSTAPAGYTMSDRRCIDCQLYSDGIPVKPDFWP